MLPAAYELEHCLIKLSSSACKENNFHHDQGFERYPVRNLWILFIWTSSYADGLNFDPGGSFFFLFLLNQLLP